MIIAVDAMGGDFAPRVVVEGIVEAAKENFADFILVGDENRIMELLKQKLPPRIEILHTDQFVEMHESPTGALKKKPNASVFVGAKLVRDGKAQALISAGNTGALLESALLFMGRIKGIKRPAIATFIPTRKSPCILLDSGANVDCKPEFLLQFAQMASIYAEKIMGRENPKVGLLNIGEEENKGDSLSQEAFKLLKSSGLNFVGNTEIKDFLSGKVDIAVCDGFVGNFVLKTAEATSDFLLSSIKSAVGENLLSKLGGLLVKPALKNVKKKLDQSEYGGAPFFGVKGVCIKSHGRADAMALYNAAKMAARAIEQNLVETISTISA